MRPAWLEAAAFPWCDSDYLRLVIKSGAYGLHCFHVTQGDKIGKVKISFHPFRRVEASRDLFVKLHCFTGKAGGFIDGDTGAHFGKVSGRLIGKASCKGASYLGCPLCFHVAAVSGYKNRLACGQY